MDSLVKQLIIKDLDLNRKFIPAVLAAGLVSITVASLSEFGFFIGSLLFITTIVALGIMIGIYSVAQERDKQTHLFILSLPITSAQYTVAKIISSLICFGLPWAVLTIVIVAAIFGLDSVPDGSLPYVTIIQLYFLCNFCIFLAVIICSSSEKIMVAAIIGTNTCITLALHGFSRIPSIAQTIETNQIVWSPMVIAVVISEIVFCFLCLATAVYIQKQKTDLV